jgi:hypothetical protein
MLVDWKSTLIRARPSLVGHRFVAQTDFAGATNAALGSAFAPIAACRMPGVSDRGKWSRVRQFVLSRSCKPKRESQHANSR